MTAKMRNALVESVGLFSIVIALALFAIPQTVYAGRAVEKGDTLVASNKARCGWVQDESGNWLYYDAQSIMTSDSTSPSYLAGENNRLSDMRSRGWYVSPLLADENNTREERIEAMISTAYEYYGDTYKACYSQL